MTEGHTLHTGDAVRADKGPWGHSMSGHGRGAEALGRGSGCENV